MNRLLGRLAVSLLGLAAMSLAGVNLALNLPATRDLLSGLQPERFAVDWERAWMLYPLRVVLVGVAADGQTPTEQWQVNAARAAASVSLLPLLRGEIRIHDLDLTDIDVRLRPRPRPDAAHEDIRAYFPVIRHRDPDTPAEPAPAASDSALVLEIDDIRVAGEHAFWVSHVRGSLPGEVRGSFRVDTDAGRLALSGGALDLVLASLKIGPEERVIDAASIRGSIEIPPFTIAEAQGLQLIRVPAVDAEVDLPVQDLALLARVSPLLATVDLRGAGRLRGRLVLSGGEALRGTDLVVEAHRLGMHLGPYGFEGDGAVELRVDPEDDARADLSVRFDAVQASLEPSDDADTAQPLVLFAGHGLTAQLHAAEVDPTTTSTATDPRELPAEVEMRLLMAIPSMDVADISVYNRLFPDTWDLTLLGGTGTVSGTFDVNEDDLTLHLDLASDDADLRLAGYHAALDLLLQLRAVVASQGGSTEAATLDMADTRVVLQDVQLADADHDDGSARRWAARLQVGEAALKLPLAADPAGDRTTRSILRTLAHEGFGTLLQSADGAASAVLTVTPLDWIAEVLDRPMGLALGGSGEIDARIALNDGLPAAGSSLRIPRQTLTVDLLQHRVEGAGEASVQLEGGPGRSQARVTVAFEDARMHRVDEPRPTVGDVRLDAEVLVHDPFAKPMSESGAAAELSLVIHAARVLDMSTFNPYLPQPAGFSLVGGDASLAGDLKVTPDSAAGQLLLDAEDIRVAMAAEELSGDLRLELLIRDGSAADLRFDISGSSLVLDGFQVAGNTGSTTDDHWHARLQLEDTEVLWQKPMHLDLKADLTIKDTRPFAAILDNVREKHGWIDNLLTVEDLGGHIALTIDGDTAVLRDAMVSGPEIGVHAKGRASNAGAEGMLLVRWHDLSGAMALQGEHRRFDVIDALDRPGRIVAKVMAKPDRKIVDTEAPARAPSPGSSGLPPAGRERRRAPAAPRDSRACRPGTEPGPRASLGARRRCRRGPHWAAWHWLQAPTGSKCAVRGRPDCAGPLWQRQRVRAGAHPRRRAPPSRGHPGGRAHRGPEQRRGDA
jgi:hypothetical protein